MNNGQSINVNHISKNLTTEKVNELKTLYNHYHKKSYCYKSAYKKLDRKWKITAEFSTVYLQQKQ